jgi:drug/metabolite transporter (DMT)-like permease
VFVGEAASLGAALIWSGSMSLFSVQAKDLPAEAINLFKNLVASVCFAVAWLVIRPAVAGDGAMLGLLALSGVIGIAIGDTALFAALQRLGPQVTSACQCLAPPIAALVAALTLGETLSSLETAGMFVTATAVAGVIYFGRADGTRLATVPGRVIAAGIFYAVLSATCQAAGLVISRHAMQDVHVLSGTIVRIAPAFAVLVVMIVSGPGWRTLRARRPTARQIRYLAVASFAGTFLGLLLMTIGVKYAKAGVAAALTSTYPLWIIPIARFVLKEHVSWQTVACTLVAVVGIVLLVIG